MTSEAEISFINFLIDHTCHAVTRLESFTGLGNEPSLTFRHKVAELKGKIGGDLGRLGFEGFELLTSCASRTYALSGSSSKTKGISSAANLQTAEASAGFDSVRFNDISSLSIRPLAVSLDC